MSSNAAWKPPPNWVTFSDSNVSALPDMRAADETVEDSGGPCCPICLEAPSKPLALPCMHIFCTSCICRYGRTLAQQRLPLSCPCCKEVVPSVDVEARLPEVWSVQRRRPTSTTAPPMQPWWVNGGHVSLTPEGRRELARASGLRARLRYCPRCAAPVAKNGGCDHMRCVCGCDFSWRSARPVNRSCHMHTALRCAERAVGAAGKTLAVAAGGTAILGTAAVVLPVAATVVSVPAALCGPLALVYEPIRRTRIARAGLPSRSRANPFTKAAGVGAKAVYFTFGAAVHGVIGLCGGYDSD